ncbi:MAG: hypothetical protein MZV63_71565 [Marinilabiliales bacterium]|nr:hypothetical protein [Marinilabiliales bacterium]
MGKYRKAYKAMMRIFEKEEERDPEILEHMGYIHKSAGTDVLKLLDTGGTHLRKDSIQNIPGERDKQMQKIIKDNGLITGGIFLLTGCAASRKSKEVAEAGRRSNADAEYKLQ